MNQPLYFKTIIVNYYIEHTNNTNLELKMLDDTKFYNFVYKISIQTNIATLITNQL